MLCHKCTISLCIIKLKKIVLTKNSMESEFLMAREQEQARFKSVGRSTAHVRDCEMLSSRPTGRLEVKWLCSFELDVFCSLDISYYYFHTN